MLKSGAGFQRVRWGFFIFRYDILLLLFPYENLTKSLFQKSFFSRSNRTKISVFFTKLWDNCGKNQKKCNLQFDFLWMTVTLSANKQV